MRGKWKRTPESRAKTSEAMKEYNAREDAHSKTEEYREECRKRAISLGSRPPDRTGIKPSEEHVERIRLALIGREVPEEVRDKISQSVSSIWSNPESVYNSEEYRETLGASHRGKYGSQTTTGSYDGGYFYLCSQFEHPLAQEGSLAEHRKVLWEKLGCESLDCEHECHWCGELLIWGGCEGINVDHLNGIPYDNRPENLVPSCQGCNVARARVGNPIDWIRV